MSEVFNTMKSEDKAGVLLGGAVFLMITLIGVSAIIGTTINGGFACHV